MKTQIKTFTCVATVSFAFMSCDNDTSTNNINPAYSINNEMPIMDSRVVAYKKSVTYQTLLPRNDIIGNELLGNIPSDTDEDILELIFPEILKEKQAECNYFALYFGTSSRSLEYWILSQDMTLYLITPGTGDSDNPLCGLRTEDALISAMLICDTAEGNLKNKIKLNSTRGYADPNWDCSEHEESRGVFF
jgi:hypothetical protein